MPKTCREYRKTLKVLVLTNMYPTPEAPSFGTFVKKQVESLRGEGIEIDVLFVNGSKNRLNYLWAFPRLWARLLTRRYDLIHAHYVFSGIIARAQFFYPIILTHHGSQVFQGWQAPVCRLITKFMDQTIVMSPEMKEKGRLNKSLIIPCGIDFKLFLPIPCEQARNELNLPKDKKLVLFVGQYYKRVKRWDIVHASMKILKARKPDVELILVSGKPLEIEPKYMLGGPQPWTVRQPAQKCWCFFIDKIDKFIKMLYNQMKDERIDRVHSGSNG